MTKMADTSRDIRHPILHACRMALAVYFSDQKPFEGSIVNEKRHKVYVKCAFSHQEL